LQVSDSSANLDRLRFNGLVKLMRNGDWRRATGQEAEYLFRRSIVPEIGELRCRDLKAAHLRAVLRKLAGNGLEL
jgi:hypothetical protein